METPHDEKNRDSMPMRIRIAWGFHLLSFLFLLCAFIPFIFPYSWTATLIDFILGGKGLAYDAQGGAFGTLYLIGGSLLTGWVSYLCGLGVANGCEAYHVPQLQYNNKVGVLLAIVVVLCLMMGLSLLNS